MTAAEGFGPLLISTVSSTVVADPSEADKEADSSLFMAYSVAALTMTNLPVNRNS